MNSTLNNDSERHSNIGVAPKGRAFLPPKSNSELRFYYNRYGGSCEPAWSSTGRPALRVDDASYFISDTSFADITTRTTNACLLVDLYDRMRVHSPHKDATESVRRATDLLCQLFEDRAYIPHVKEVSAFCHVLGLDNFHHAYVMLSQIAATETGINKDIFMARVISICGVYSATAKEHHISNLGELVVPKDPLAPSDDYTCKRRSVLQNLTILVRLAMSTTSTGPYYLWLDTRPRSEKYYEFRFEGVYYLIGFKVAHSETHLGIVLHRIFKSLRLRYRVKKFNHARAKYARVVYHGPMDYLKEKFSPMTKIDAVAEKASALIEKVDSFIPTREAVKEFVYDPENVVMPLMQCVAHSIASPDKWVTHSAIVLLMQLPKWTSGGLSPYLAATAALTWSILSRSGFSILGKDVPVTVPTTEHGFFESLGIFKSPENETTPEDVEYVQMPSFKQKALDYLDSITAMFHGVVSWIFGKLGIEDYSFLDSFLKAMTTLTKSAIRVALVGTIAGVISTVLKHTFALFRRLFIKLTGADTLLDVPMVTKKIENWVSEVGFCLESDKKWLISKLSVVETDKPLIETFAGKERSLTALNKLTPTMVKTYHAEVSRLVREGRGLRNDLMRAIRLYNDGGAGVSAIQRVLDQSFNEISRLEANIATMIQSAPEQQDRVPTCLVLSGESGVGKTALLSEIAGAIAIREGKTTDTEIAQFRTDEVYGRPMAGDNKFMTGYAGQMILVYDDICQYHADETTPDVFFGDLIHAVSPFTAITNQAAIGDKGRPFSSKYLIATTNQTRIDAQVNRGGVREEAAIHNRIHAFVKVELKDAYKIFTSSDKKQFVRDEQAIAQLSTPMGAFDFTFHGSRAGEPLKTIHIGRIQIPGRRFNFDEFIKIYFKICENKESFEKRTRVPCDRLGRYQRTTVLDMSGDDIPLATPIVGEEVCEVPVSVHESVSLDALLARVNTVDVTPRSLYENIKDRIVELTSLGVDTTNWNRDTSKCIDRALSVQMTDLTTLTEKIEVAKVTKKKLLESTKEILSGDKLPAKLKSSDAAQIPLSARTAPLITDFWRSFMGREFTADERPTIERFSGIKAQLYELNADIVRKEQKLAVVKDLADRMSILLSLLGNYAGHEEDGTVKKVDFHLAQSEVDRAASLKNKFIISLDRRKGSWDIYIDTLDPIARTPRYVHDTVLLPIIRARNYNEDVMTCVRGRTILDLTGSGKEIPGKIYQFPVSKITSQPVIPIPDIEHVDRVYKASADTWIPGVLPAGVFSFLTGAVVPNPGENYSDTWRKNFASAPTLTSKQLELLSSLTSKAKLPKVGDREICPHSTICSNRACSKYHHAYCYTARDLLAIMSWTGVETTANSIRFLYPHPSNNFQTMETSPDEDEIVTLLKSNDTNVGWNLSSPIPLDRLESNPRTSAKKLTGGPMGCFDLASDALFWLRRTSYQGYRAVTSGHWTAKLAKIGGLILGIFLALKGMKALWRYVSSAITPEPATDFVETPIPCNSLPPSSLQRRSHHGAVMKLHADEGEEEPKKRDLLDILTSEDIAPPDEHRQRPKEKYLPHKIAADYITRVSNQTACFTGPDSTRSLGVLTFISDRVAITCRHVADAIARFFEKSTQPGYLRFKFNQSGIPITKDDYVVTYSSTDGPGDHRDLCFLNFGAGRFGAAFAGFRSIVKAWPDITDSILYRFTIRLIDGKLHFMLSAHDPVITGTMYQTPAGTTSHVVTINAGSPGDSGSVVIAVDNTRASIVGLYSGATADTNAGVVALTDYDELIRAVSKAPGSRQYFVEEAGHLRSEGTQRYVNEKPEQSFRFIGVDPCSPVQVGPTKLPSLIHGMFNSPTRGLAVTNPVTVDNVVRDPIKIGITKGKRKMAPHDPELAALAVKGAVNRMRIACFDVDRSRIKSIHETIYGREGDHSRTGLNTDASPGCAFKQLLQQNYHIPIKTNKDWMEIKNCSRDCLAEWLDAAADHSPIDVSTIDEKFVAEYAAYEAEVLEDFDNGILHPSLVIDMPKAETRPLEKVEAVKTRIFSVFADVRTQIFLKRLIGGALEMMESRPITSGSAIGMNVYSHNHVSKLVSTLTVQGLKNIIAGDFRNFDGSHPHRTVDMLCNEIVEQFYPLNSPRLKELQKYALKSVSSVTHRAHNVLWQSESSIPSGCFGTTNFNNGLNDTAHRYCYLKLARIHNPTLATNYHYDKLIRPVYYGDDVVMSVSSSILPWFNQKTLIETMPDLGYDYTLETKIESHDDIPLSRHLGEVTFLKRHFVLFKSTGLIRMALAKESIENMPNFVATGNPLGKATFDNCVAALCEAALWGDEYFQDLRTRLVDALCRQGLYGKYETDSNFGHPRNELPRNARDVLWRVDHGQLPSEIKTYLRSQVNEDVDPTVYTNEWAIEAYRDFFKAWNGREVRSNAIKEVEFLACPLETSEEAIKRFETALLESAHGPVLRELYSAATVVPAIVPF